MLQAFKYYLVLHRGTLYGQDATLTTHIVVEMFVPVGKWTVRLF